MKDKKIKINFNILLVLLMVFLTLQLNINITNGEMSNDFNIKGIWASGFGTSENEQYEAIQMNVDGTYIVAGSTSGNNYDVAGRNHGQVDGILSKYNKDGELIWSKIVGGNNEDYFSEVKVLKDGRIAAAGYTESSNSGDVPQTKYGYDSSWIMLFDKDGNKIWSQVNGRSGAWGYTAFRGITETKDGNIVCVGYAYGDGDGNIPGVVKGERDTFIVKFDVTNGNKMWHKFNGGTKNETFFDVVELSSGKLVGVGQSESNDGDFTGKNKGGYDAMAIIYSPDGNMEKTITFGGSKDDNFVAVEKTSENKIVAAGNTFSDNGDITTPTFGGRDGMFVSFLNDGTYEWQKIVGGNGEDYLTYMTEGVDGNFSVVGYTNSTKSGALDLENHGGYDGLFAVLSKTNGDLEHLVLFGGAQDDNTETVATTSDGGYVAAGHTRSLNFDNLEIENRGGRDAFIAKFKTNNIPLLEAPGFTEIAVGQNFDLMAGVTSADFEDGDLLSKVTITTDFNKDVAGVYPVKYKVKDYENNEVTVTSVVLVNDGKYKAGSEYILYGDDYTITRGKVIKDKIDVETRAKVKVYSKENGLLIKNNDNVAVDYGQYKNVIGLYDIGFSLVSEPTLSVTIKADVIKGYDPVLTIKEYDEINVNEFFDPYEGLSALDAEDLNITNKVIIENYVNNSVPGIYEVSYSITDSDYNTVVKTQNVIVKGEGIKIGTNYVIEAYDYEIFAGKVNGSDDEIKTFSLLRVYDKVNKEFVTNPGLTIDKSGYTNVADDYPIAISLDAEPGLTHTITASVVSGAAPTIRGANFLELSVGASFDSLHGVKLSDDEDSNEVLLNNLVISGSVDTNVAGVYKLTYTLDDSDFNTVVVDRVVLVNDGNYTVGQNYIIKAEDYSIKSRNVVVSNQDIISKAKVVVYRKNNGLVDRNAEVVVNYGSYSSTVGVYPITFKLKLDRLATKTIKADVNIGEPPVITGDDIVYVSPSDSVDLSKYISVSDLEQGNIINDVEMNGTFNPGEVGVYPVTYTLQDIDGNEVTFKQIIVVNDGSIRTTKSYFVAYDSFEINVKDVDTNDEAILKEAKLRIWDKATGLQLPLDIVEVDKKEYTNVAGSYRIMLSIKTDRSLYDFITATVIDDTPVEPTIKPTEKPTKETTVKLPGTGDNTAFVGLLIAMGGALLAIVKMTRSKQ